MIKLNNLVELLNKKNEDYKDSKIDYKEELALLISANYITLKNESKRTNFEMENLKKNLTKVTFKEKIGNIFSYIILPFSKVMLIASIIQVFLFIYNLIENGFNNITIILFSIFIGFLLFYVSSKIVDSRTLEITNRKEDIKIKFINNFLSNKKEEKNLIEEVLLIINDLENIKSNYNKEVIEELRNYLIEESYKIQIGNSSELFNSIHKDISQKILFDESEATLCLKLSNSYKRKKINSKKITQNKQNLISKDIEDKFNLIIKTNNDLLFPKNKAN